MDKKTKMLSEYEDRILDLIDNRDDFTRSDLQGCAGAIVLSMFHDVNAISERTPKALNAAKTFDWFSGYN